MIATCALGHWCRYMHMIKPRAKPKFKCFDPLLLQQLSLFLNECLSYADGKRGANQKSENETYHYVNRGAADKK